MAKIISDTFDNVIKHPRELKPHPLNIEIYGEENVDSDLVKSIKLKGILEPLVIKEDNTILSGHRRWKAAKSLKISKLPCRIITFSDPLVEMEALMEFNRQRVKTITQKMREKDKFAWIEKQLANQRQKATQLKGKDTKGKPIVGSGHLAVTDGKGEAREKLAKRIGLSTGSMRRVIPIWDKAKAGDVMAIALMKKLDAGEITINAAFMENKKADVEAAEKPLVAANNVFGNTCELVSLAADKFRLPLNKRNKSDGIAFMKKLPAASIPCAFFDPQYRGVLDALSYGNEGDRQKDRVELSQMTDKAINGFCREIYRVLIPSGHLFLWTDKYHVAEGTAAWFEGTGMKAVDLITWNKERFGMGFRTRRVAEYLLVLQKPPTRAKGVWCVHTIRDVWSEKTNGEGGKHPHKKPIELQAELIKAVTRVNDVILDPAAGSFSVMISANKVKRNFIGCDIEG